MDSAQQERLDEFKESLIQLRPTEEVCHLVVSYLSDMLSPEGIGIYLWQEEQGAFVVWPEQEGVVQRLMIFDPFLLYLTEHEGLFRPHDFSAAGSEHAAIAQEAARFFRDVGADLILPLVLNQSMVGIIFVRSRQTIDATAMGVMQEVRTLAVMALSNSILYARLEGILAHLEEKVRERTRELENAQSQLVQSEKMAMLGVMVAGIAHEINTPASVIHGGVVNVESSMRYLLSNLQEALRLVPADRQHAFARVVKQIGLVVSSGSYRQQGSSFQKKRVLLPQLEAAGLPQARDLAAFLVENGLCRIDGAGPSEPQVETFMRSRFMKALGATLRGAGKEHTPRILEVLTQVANSARNLRNIGGAIKSIVRIVRALKHYSHLDQGQMTAADLHEGLENTLIILDSVNKQEIRFVRNFGELPPVVCNPDELNQVWTNLLNNAFHALRGIPEARVEIRTGRAELDGRPGVSIEIEDNGSGMPPEVASRIWDPFFTTKDQGEGSGLGLGIVKGIVENHGGRIDVRSTVGQGTVFRVRLPLDPEKRAQ